MESVGSSAAAELWAELLDKCRPAIREHSKVIFCLSFQFYRPLQIETLAFGVRGLASFVVERKVDTAAAAAAASGQSAANAPQFKGLGRAL